MAIVLYLSPYSAGCRTVLMTAEHLGIQLVKKNVDLFSGEQMKQEFLAMNPEHCVPTIDDDGFYLWESRAIATYLVNKYAPNNDLYPQDPKARAVVDKMLNYDLGHLYQAFYDNVPSMMFKKCPPDPEKVENLKKSLEIFEKILERRPYAAGNHLTVADYSILSCLVTAEEVMEYSFADFPKISAWLEKLKKEAPNYKEINEIPLLEFKQLHLQKFRQQ